MWPYFNFKCLVHCSGICLECYWNTTVLFLEAYFHHNLDVHRTHLPSPSWSSLPISLPCFTVPVCLSSVFLPDKSHTFWLIDVCWANRKCSSTGNNSHKLKLRWSLLMVCVFFSFCPLLQHNSPNRLEFKFVYIFQEESTFPKKKPGTKPPFESF